MNFFRSEDVFWPDMKAYSIFLFCAVISISSLEAYGQEVTLADKAFDSLVESLCEGSVTWIDEASVRELKTKNWKVLDCREKEEFEVSHLEDATWVGYNNYAPKRNKSIARSDTILVYCSVGYRSEKIGERLMKQGYENVFNLKGGIFSWVNEGNEVETSNHRKTEKVHPYDEAWGLWLKAGTKAYD